MDRLSGFFTLWKWRGVLEYGTSRLKTGAFWMVFLYGKLSEKIETAVLSIEKPPNNDYFSTGRKKKQSIEV